MNERKSFTLEFETENAAFADNPGYEIARILRKIARRIEFSPQDLAGDVVVIADLNGNTVGQWQWDGPPEEE